MGLYLAIFNVDHEINGVETGAYTDFNALRNYIIQRLEDGKAGSRFPTFVLHSDCDGEWSVADCKKLQLELHEISEALKNLPSVPFISDWQKAVAGSIGLMPESAFNSFIDVDGEPLLGRLQDLVKDAVSYQLPILFQ